MVNKHASVLADRCAGLARLLTYNNGSTEAQVKHTLREASYFIDSQIITVTKTRDGLRMRTARGQERYLTFRESLAYWLLKGRTEIRIRPSRAEGDQP